MPRIGGYGSGYILIIIVAKAVSKYLDRGHFKWKKKVKTFFNQAKKVTKICINIKDNINQGSCIPGTIQ